MIDTANYFVIDLETTSLNRDAGVWQFGIVSDKGQIVEATCNPDTCTGHKDLITLGWQESNNSHNWNKAQRSSMSEEQLAKNLWIALTTMIGRNTKIYSQGLIDQDWAHYLLSRYHYSIPWTYWQWLDLRSINSFMRVRKPRNSVTHNAKEDAIAEMRELQFCIQRRGDLEWVTLSR